MDDGVRLAATLYLPEPGDGGDGPWPALLGGAALPQGRRHRVLPAGVPAARRGRLRDVPRRRPWHRAPAKASPTDEYPAVERTDLMTVIDWLATRDWSTGSVGMYGTSYSGFNSIQLAMERPPALKAIIPIFATDDRFGDDVHYFGGARKQLDLVDYPTYMVAMNALPPVPSIFGDGWREEWERRVAEHRAVGASTGSSTNASTTTGSSVRCGSTSRRSSPHDDHRGVGRRLSQQHLPHLRGADLPEAADHRAVVARLHRHVPAGTEPRPDPRAPQVVGPLVEGRRQRRRVANRRSWCTRSARPCRRPTAPRCVGRGGTNRPGPPSASPPRRGRWRRPRPIVDDDGPDELDVRGDVGWTAWISCAGAMPWGQSSDQRPDEIHSLTFTWDALEDDLEIMGQARLSVRVVSSAPVAYLSAKVCDVFPDGTSSMVTRGMLNLTRRDSRTDPSPLGTRHHVRHRSRTRSDVVDLRSGPPRAARPGRQPTGRTRGRPPNR